MRLYRSALGLALVATISTGCGDGVRTWALHVENEAGPDVIVVIDGSGLSRTVRAPGLDSLAPAEREHAEGVVSFIGALDVGFTGEVRVLDARTCEELDISGPVPHTGKVWLDIQPGEKGVLSARYWVDDARHTDWGGLERPDSTDCQAGQ